MSHRDSNRVSTAPNLSCAMFGIPTNCTVPLSMKLSNFCLVMSPKLYGRPVSIVPCAMNTGVL